MSPFLPLYFHCVRIYYLTLSGVAWGKFYSLLNKSYHGMAWHQMAHVCPRPGVLVPYVWKRNYKNSHWKFLLTFKFTHIHRELIKLKSWCENKVIPCMNMNINIWVSYILCSMFSLTAPQPCFSKHRIEFPIER